MMKANPQGADFQVRSSLDTPGLVSKLNGLFGNRNLPLTSKVPPRAIAIAYIILRVS